MILLMRHGGGNFWMGFVGRINKSRAYISTFLISFTLIVVYQDSMVRGGKWINIVLLMYVAIDKNPKNGLETQNLSCGKLGIVLHLKLVKTKTNNEVEE